MLLKAVIYFFNAHNKIFFKYGKAQIKSQNLPLQNSQPQVQKEKTIGDIFLWIFPDQKYTGMLKVHNIHVHLKYINEIKIFMLL